MGRLIGSASQLFRQTRWDQPLPAMEWWVSTSDPTNRWIGDPTPTHLVDRIDDIRMQNGQAVCLHLAAHRGQQAVSALLHEPVIQEILR